MARGPRGPRPTPTFLRVLQGNPGKRPIRPEPQPPVAAAVPEAPSFLAEAAQEEWQRIAGVLHGMKLLTTVDLSTFAAYCQAYARWRAAEEALARMAAGDPLMKGLLVKSSKDSAMENPLLFISRRAASDMVRYAAEFGLTPAARARLAVGLPGDKPPSKFDGLIGI